MVFINESSLWSKAISLSCGKPCLNMAPSLPHNMVTFARFLCTRFKSNYGVIAYFSNDFKSGKTKNTKNTLSLCRNMSILFQVRKCAAGVILCRLYLLASTFYVDVYDVDKLWALVDINN